MKAIFHTISLSRFLAILLTIAVLPPLSISIVWVISERYNHELQLATNKERQVNLMMKNQIGSDLERLFAMLKDRADAMIPMLENATGLKDPSNRIQAVLSNLVTNEALIHEAFILDRNAAVVAGYDPDVGGIIQEDSRVLGKPLDRTNLGLSAGQQNVFYTLPLLGRDYIGNPTPHSGTSVLIRSIPIGNPSIAILVALLDVDQLWNGRISEAETSLQGTRNYIVDRRGMLVHNILGTQFKTGDQMTKFPVVRAGLIEKVWPADRQYIGVSGEPVFSVIVSIPHIGWSLISEVPVQSIRAPVLMHVAKILLLLLIVVLLFLAVLRALFHRMIRPISELRTAIIAATNGHYDERPSRCGVEELDDVAFCFNAMMDSRQRAEVLQAKNYDRLLKSQQVFRDVLEGNDHGILMVDKQGKIALSNRAIAVMSGYTKQELLDIGIDMLLPERMRDHHKDVFKDFYVHPRARPMRSGREIYLLCKDGREIPVDISLTHVETENGVLVTAMIQDISEQKQALEKIARQANFDPVTDLPNRFLAMDRLSQTILESKRDKNMTAILFLDLDHFKKINDSLGHEVGDQVLVEAAIRLQASVRKGDTVARLGGDEFLVILGRLKKSADVRPVIKNILSKFKSPFSFDGRNLVMTTSIGIAIYPDDGLRNIDLLRNADTAMYHAKHLGRNHYTFFTEEMNVNLSRQLAVEEQLHGAFDRNEFEIHLQPKIDLSTSVIGSAEALLRWNNKVLGDVPPDEFIGIAERSGLIIELGRHVLAISIGYARELSALTGKNFKIAVNLSPNQFRDPGLVTFIEDELQKNGIQADHLELELTEGVLLSGHPHIERDLNALHSLGIRIAMDDFGTGYSSLSYLRSYPFDIVKIDRSFIDDIEFDEADRDLVSASISMAHALNLQVVAEGIENDVQLAMLKDMGCDIGQGYLFGKPMPFSDMYSLLQREPTFDLKSGAG